MEERDSGRRVSASPGERGRLRRSLGLRETLTIGMGTMIGAGIFVFPGLAVGRAGPAAALSFAIGAGIALLVAMPASELATAMPRSGGGYYFVSRGLGALPGSLVGIGQWLGLIFASAFYLAGFGFYATDLLARLGLPSPVPHQVLGSAGAVALTAVAIVGTRTAGRLQAWIVAVLLAILAAFLGVGVLRMVGAGPDALLPGPFAPFGALPVVTTAALVFTSYLGFAQIAGVAGEVRDPSRTLPRAMIGSVAIVGALYVLTIFVASGVSGTGALAEAGETALSLVARDLLGPAGALVVSAAGLFATFSSANASILGSSRSVFALSRDGIVPGAASRISHRFRTPHVALLLTGGPIAGIVLLGRLEVLAEVASLLHLVMYGLICFSLIPLRRARPHWYRPDYRAPGYPALPVLGGVASFALIGFMSIRSIAIGAALLALAAAWRLLYARGVRIVGRAEEKPAPVGLPATVLVAAELPDPPRLPAPLLAMLGPERVVALGWVAVPEQATPEQVREELGDEAEAALDELAGWLRGEGGMDVDTELVFTDEPVATVERTAADRSAEATIVLRDIAAIRTIAAAVHDPALLETVAGHAAWIAGGARARVVILHPVVEDEDEPALSDLGSAAGLRARFRRAGVSPDRVESRACDTRDADAILDAAEDADLLVVGERHEPGGERAFGEPSRRLIERAEVPVVIVRRAAEARPPDRPGEKTDRES